MLVIAKGLSQLSFSRLMEVYEEGNAENARESGISILDAEQDFYVYLQDVFFSTHRALYAIWEAEGIYCSALRLEPYRDGWLLAGLETAPKARRRGYAQKLVRATLSYLGQGKVYSHIHKENVPSLSLHEKLGFSRISNEAVYIDGSANDRCATYLMELREELWQEN